MNKPNEILCAVFILNIVTLNQCNACSCSGLAFRLFSPAYPYIIDPLGRRLGINPEDGIDYHEIPALSTLGDPSHTIHPDFETKAYPDPVKYVFMHKPMEGRYTIFVVGTGKGIYKLEINAISADCMKNTTYRKGAVKAGKVDTVLYQYSGNAHDTVAPVTKVNYLPGTWRGKGAAPIQFAAHDDCSGVARTYVRLNGGSEGPVTEQLPMDREGSIHLEYWSLDNSWNREAAQTIVVHTDFTPPTTAHDYRGDGVETAPFTIRFHASDTLSGVDFTKVIAAGAGSEMEITNIYREGPPKPLILKKPAHYSITYWSKDHAGNCEGVKTLRIRIGKKRWMPWKF